MINFGRVYNIVVLYQRCDSTGPGPQWWPYWMSRGQMLDPLGYDHQIGCWNQGSFYYQPKQCTIKPPQHNHTYIHIFDLHNLIHPQKIVQFADSCKYQSTKICLIKKAGLSSFTFSATKQNLRWNLPLRLTRARSFSSQPYCANHRAMTNWSHKSSVPETLKAPKNSQWIPATEKDLGHNFEKYRYWKCTFADANIKFGVWTCYY